MDLNLHHPNTAKPRNEQHAREMLNRTRAWLNCFNLDRSTGSQYGKPAIIRNTDYTANRSDQWWNSSPYNMKGFDIHLAGYNAELTVLADFRAKIHSDPGNPTGFNKVCTALLVRGVPADWTLFRIWISLHWHLRRMTSSHACGRPGLRAFGSTTTPTTYRALSVLAYCDWRTATLG